MGRQVMDAEMAASSKREGLALIAPKCPKPAFWGFPVVNTPEKPEVP